MNVGDRVHWTHVSTGCKTISMSRREGEIVEIAGAMATVKKTSGRKERVRIVRLRQMGAASQITEFVEVMRNAKGE